MVSTLTKGREKRLAIFSFYDKEGIVEDYVEYLLKDLSQCAERLIIVINGALSQAGREILKKYSIEIVVRPNKGFDAGAYKDILIHYLTKQELYRYVELVLCNNTFFGPFVPFRSIFYEMSEVACDFWGLNYFEDQVADYLQSNFLVFRKSVLWESDFYMYFEDQIDEETVVLKNVYAQFERGLFAFLVKSMKKTWASYIKVNNCDPYKSCNFCIKKYQLPIMKRKAFLPPIYNIQNIIDALQSIERYTDYDIALILNSVHRSYHFHMTQREVEDFPVDLSKTEECCIPISVMAAEKIEMFITNSLNVYIYGAGSWARTLFWVYLREDKKFKGFIVSDRETIGHSTVFGHPIYSYSEVENKKSIHIIVGLHDKVDEVRDNMKQHENVLYLW